MHVLKTIRRLAALLVAMFLTQALVDTPVARLIEAVAHGAMVLPVAGADTVVLKDGTVLEGTITREVEGNVWIKVVVGGIEQERFYAAAELKSFSRGDSKGDDAKQSSKEAAQDDVQTTNSPFTPGVTRAAVITLGDEQNGHMVGVYMTAESLKRAIPLLEEELGTDGSGIVVLRIHSGGGLLLEVQKLSDVIHNEYKKRWRTVAWIESAISAAAMTSHCMEEIYFTRQGNYGACTAFAGSLDAPVEGRALEEILAQMERISARGGHDTLIMRAMQIQQPLSATTLRDGTVKFFPDLTSGEFVVNRDKEILTFNANSATKAKFSKGTADTLAELQALLDVEEVVWVGEKLKTIPWPVSKAEKLQMDFRRKVKEDEQRTRQYFDSYNNAIAAAGGAPEDTRAKFVGQARTWLGKIKEMVRNNPNQAILIWNGEEEYKKWLEEQEKLLRDLTRRNNN